MANINTIVAGTEVVYESPSHFIRQAFALGPPNASGQLALMSVPAMGDTDGIVATTAVQVGSPGTANSWYPLGGDAP
jgi:hypothetical protein